MNQKYEAKYPVYRDQNSIWSFSWDGRCDRGTWFLATVIWTILAIVAAVIALNKTGSFGWASLAYACVSLPAFCAGIRRLHDTGRSGWFLLIECAPVLGFIILLVFWLSKGDLEPNTYGMPVEYTDELNRQEKEKAGNPP